MSFLKSLFGGGKAVAADKAPAVVKSLEHEGYLIEAAPLKDGGQFLVAGTISKEVGGERREHKFIRADRTPSIEDAAEMTIRKGQQIIEHMGERMFSP